MRIDENSIDFLMKILSDLYSDPQLAVIREYSVNARDSHVEAGVTRPIEITTPTRLSPHFKVQDFGLGLSIDDIRTIYSAYGASTKRNSNTQAGMLGLGSKSGLTISDQFMVTAIKDGIKAYVSVTRTETGGATMEIIDTVATTESNGVLISIPLGHNLYGFEDKVNNFFKYWPEGSVLINGKAPEQVKSDFLAPGIRIVDNKVKNTSYYGTATYEDLPDIIVMGGIAYPIESEYTPGFRTQFHLIFDVPIGSVNFTPSREQLHYTKQTKATIEDCYARYDAEMANKVSNDLLAANTIKEALEAASKWATRLGHSDIPANWQYKGNSLPTKIGPYEYVNSSEYDFEFKPRTMNIYDWYNLKPPGSNNYYGSPAEYVIVTDFTMKEVTSYARSRINAYKAKKGSYRFIITVDNKVAEDPWLADIKSMTWKDILAATREPKAAAPAFKTDKEFHVLRATTYTYANGTTADSIGFEIKEVPAGKQVYYFEPRDYPKLNEHALFRLVEQIDAVAVKVYARRKEDFDKSHPTAKHIRDIVPVLQAKYDSEVSDVDKYHTAAYQAGISIDWLPKDKIDDPELKKIIELSLEPKDSKRKFNQTIRDLNELELSSIKESRGVFNLDCLKKYRLFTSLDEWRAKNNKEYMEDVVFYLNEIYKKRK